MADIWHCWDSLERATTILIAIMAVDAIVVTCHSLYRDRIAREQTSAFTRDSAELMRDGRLDEIIAVAAQNKRSPLASVVGASLIAFASAPPEFSHSEAVAKVERAFHRCRRLLAAERRQGLRTLNTIATCAVMIGVLGTCFGVASAFGSGEKHTVIARTSSNIARAVAITGLGLIVSIAAILCRSALRRSVEAFESEMLKAKFDVFTGLAIGSQDLDRPKRGADDALGFLSVTPGDPAARSWEFPYERQQPLALAMCLYGLYIAFDVISRVVH